MSVPIRHDNLDLRSLPRKKKIYLHVQWLNVIQTLLTLYEKRTCNYVDWYYILLYVAIIVYQVNINNLFSHTHKHTALYYILLIFREVYYKDYGVFIERICCVHILVVIIVHILFLENIKSIYFNILHIINYIKL